MLHHCTASCAGSPSQLLSRAAVLVSQSAIDSMLAGNPSLTLRLVDVTPNCNISQFLREWTGEYRTQSDGHGTVLLTFDNPRSFKAASDALAGGVRGQFRVERRPAGAAAGAATTVASTMAAAHGCTSSSSGHTRASAPAPAGVFGGITAAGWQTVSSSSNKGRGADAPAAAAPDPWADDEPLNSMQGSSRAGGAGGLGGGSGLQQHIVDDWESELDAVAEVPQRPALQLDQRNMWEALAME